MASIERPQIPMKDRSVVIDGEMIVTQTPEQTRNVVTALRAIHNIGTFEAYAKTIDQIDSISQRSAQEGQLGSTVEAITLLDTLYDTYGDVGVGLISQAYAFHPLRREQTMREMRENHEGRVRNRPQMPIDGYLIS